MRRLALLFACLLGTPVLLTVHQVLERDWVDAALAVVSVGTVLLVALRIARERRRAADSERLFRMVFDAAGVGISVGADGIMSRTNRALQHMLGYSEAELADMHFTRITHPDDVAAGPRVPRPGSVYSFEKRIVHKDGETIWAEVTLTAPPDNSFGVAVIEDVTARKALEHELRQAQKMEAVGQLAGGVAHDFNNLMTAVTGYAALLKLDLPLADPRREKVDAIAGAADRAAVLTRKLLAFSRRQVLALETVDVAAVVEGFDSILRRLLPENIAVEYELERNAFAQVDRGELEQVVLNLAVNARDAMRDGGLLAIGVRAAREEVELTVTDTGVGMSDETRDRIFDPFFTTKPVGEGTGLGLSTVDGIVAQFGGTIEVSSALGSGSAFTISLPRAEGEPREQAPSAAADGRDDGKGAVLLVEDEEIVRRVTTEMLRLHGYEVVTAVNAEAALALLRGGLRPDVLVSDVVMTGVDGPALVAQARELLPDLPVLFVSGYSVEALGDRPTEVLLTKPFTVAQLVEHVEQVRAARAVLA